MCNIKQKTILCKKDTLDQRVQTLPGLYSLFEPIKGYKKFRLSAK